MLSNRLSPSAHSTTKSAPVVVILQICQTAAEVIDPGTAFPAYETVADASLVLSAYAAMRVNQDCKN